jgi:cytochrome b561
MTAANVRPHLASLALLAVGLLGLVYDHLHILFGTLLWIWVVARFYLRARQSQPLPPADIRALARGLSRSVYLLLYVLMFFRIAIGVLHRAPHQPIFGPVEDFQSYLLSGLVALATIHALAALYRHFAIQGLPAPLRYLSPKRPAKVA